MFTISEALAAQVLSDVFNLLVSDQELPCSPSEHKVSLLTTPELGRCVTLEAGQVPGSCGAEGEGLVERSWVWQDSPLQVRYLLLSRSF